MDRPTAADVRAIVPAQFLWADYGYPAGDPDPLAARVEYAAATLRLMVGRGLDTITDPDEATVAKHAVALLVMYETIGGGDAALTVMAQPWLKSFTAGSYSETRFSPQELAGGNGKTTDVLSKLHPWPALARDLWLLASPERRDEWTETLTGVHAAEGGIFTHAAAPWGDDAGVWPYGVFWPS
jgi:hypothetical protein